MNNKVRRFPSVILVVIISLVLMLSTGLLISAQGETPLTPQPLEIDLSFPTTLAITKPANNFSTYYDSYYIAGTSDPDQPLFYRVTTDDSTDEPTEIERLGTKGLFGVLFNLAEGENDLLFTQEGQEDVAFTITRTTTEEPSGTINYITEKSIFPISDTIVDPGETLYISCIGPSSGVVSATFNDETIELEQVAAADDGIPAKFAGSISIDTDYPDDEITHLGSITYNLEYDGEEKSYSSTGEILLKGASAALKIKVNSYLGYVYNDTSDLSVFRELLKKGTTDYAVGKSGGYYELASGGFLPSRMADLLDSSEDINNKISGAEVFGTQNGALILIDSSHSSAYNAYPTEEGFSLEIYSATLAKPISFEDTQLFSSVAITNEADFVLMTVKYKNPEDYWGYNIVFDESGRMFVSLQQKPKIGSLTSPLGGMRIMLDPGHGGSDPGATGVPGTLGPSESTVNLAHAYAVSNKLESLGATVLITRMDDSYYDLDNRLRDFANEGYDLFISLHHNSVDPTVDANDAKGTESYYHTLMSEDITGAILDSVCENTGRYNRGNFWSYYRVTIGHQAPSMLLELGFTSNPLEYERSTDPKEIDRVANAIATGLVSYFYKQSPIG